jgi:hypothetical protein
VPETAGKMTISGKRNPAITKILIINKAKESGERFVLSLKRPIQFQTASSTFAMGFYISHQIYGIPYDQFWSGDLNSSGQVFPRIAQES